MAKKVPAIRVAGAGVKENCVPQGWGTYLLSRAAWIVEYRWLPAKKELSLS